MPYAILRFQKRKAGGVSAIERHNERKKEAYKSNPDIDLAQIKDNYHLVRPPSTYRKEINRLIEQAACRVRRDSVVMVETLITASPNFMSSLSPPEQREYFERAFTFISERIGQQNILSSTVHMDEKTPHMHLSFCPITKDNKLSAKLILGNQAQLSKWQTDFHRYMSARWPELQRGVSSMITKRKHIPVWLFKQAQRLDKQFDEINTALANINAFNAGTKRDKALELLVKWIPEAEKFTAQLKSVNQHIESLEKALNTQSRVVDNLRVEAFANEEEAKKTSSEVYRLQRQLDQQKRLLERVPPEVWEQLKNRKERSR